MRDCVFPHPVFEGSSLCGEGFLSCAHWYLQITGCCLLQWTSLSGKEPTCQCRRCELNLWVRKTPWKRKRQLMPVFLPGKSQGQRILASYSPWGRKRVRHDLVTKQQQGLLQYSIWAYMRQKENPENSLLCQSLGQKIFNIPRSETFYFVPNRLIIPPQYSSSLIFFFLPQHTMIKNSFFPQFSTTVVGLWTPKSMYYASWVVCSSLPHLTTFKWEVFKLIIARDVPVGNKSVNS